MYFTTELYNDVEALNLNDDQAVVNFVLKLWRQIEADEKKLFEKNRPIGADDEMPILLALHAVNLSHLADGQAKEKLLKIKGKLEAIATQIQDNMVNYQQLVPENLQQKQGNEIAEPFELGFSKLFNMLTASTTLDEELSNGKKLQSYEHDQDVGPYVKKAQALKSLKSQEALIHFRDQLKKQTAMNNDYSVPNMYEEATRITANNPTKQNIRMHEQLFIYGNKPNPQLQSTLDNLKNYLDNPTPFNLGVLEDGINHQSKQQQKTTKKFINEYLKAHQTPKNAVAARKVKSLTKSELVRAKHFVQKKLFGVGKEVIKEASNGNKPLPNSKFTADQTQAVLNALSEQCSKYGSGSFGHHKNLLNDLKGMPTLEKALDRINYMQKSPKHMNEMGYYEINSGMLQDIQRILEDPVAYLQSLQQPAPDTNQYQELPLRPASSSSTPYQTISDVTQSTPSSSRPAPSTSRPAALVSTYAQIHKQPAEGPYSKLPIMPVSNEVVEKFEQFARVLESAMTVINHAKLPADLRQTDFKNAEQHYKGSSTPTDQFSEHFNFNYRVGEKGLVVAQINTLQRDLKDALEFALTKPTETEATKHLMNVINHLAQMMPEGMMTDFQQEVTAALQKDAPSARVNPSSKP